jgi:hypothetical protein
VRSGLTGSLNTTRPFQVVGFDIVKLTKSDGGNEYLLTMIDHFSRYPLAVPIPDRQMKTVVQALHTHLICVFGVPEALLSDLEKSFTSEVTKGLLQKLGITKLNTSGYMPTGNSRCERLHRYLNASLTMFVNERKTDWDQYIDSVLFAYRTSMCTSTGFTPFELVFNRKASMPPDVVYTVDGKQIQEEYRRGITVSQSMKEAYQLARERQVEVARKNKGYRDVNRKAVTFGEGSAVFIYDEVYDRGKARKLRYRFSGPHLVVKKGTNDNLYWIQRCDGKGLQLINVARLIKANVHNADLGEPLGKMDFEEGASEDEGDSEEKENGEEEQNDDGVVIELERRGDRLRRVPVVGEVVVVDVSNRLLHVEGAEMGENIDGRSFSMGVVTEVEGAQLILHWMGTYGGDPFKGEWKRTFVDTDNKRLHVNSSLKSKYDNWFTCHWVYLFDIIGEPFELLEGGHSSQPRGVGGTRTAATHDEPSMG